MSTVVKNIRQHSFEVPQYEAFVEIAKRYNMSARKPRGLALWSVSGN